MTHTDIYITDTATLYPGDTNFNNVVVRLYGRIPTEDPEKDPKSATVTVKGFEPYFYVPAAEQDDVQPANVEALVRYEETDVEPLTQRFEQGSRTTDLVKVITSAPHKVRELRKRFDTTWSADTIFSERFRIDKEIRTGVRVPDSAEKRGNHYVVDESDIEAAEVEDVEPRVLTFDIETDDRGTGFPEPGDARILSIVAHDSYQDECVGFIDLNGRSLEQHFGLDEPPESLDDMGLTELDQLEFEPEERRMLIRFASWVNSKDPDLICGWNSADPSTDGFDLPHVIERMSNVGANPTRLSREGEVETWYDARNDGHCAEITGRAVYDLMDGWGDTKFTEPDSFKLEDVAKKETHYDGKISHEGMGFYEMYREDPVKFLNYNAKDVSLTVSINEQANVLGFKKRLKDMVGVDWSRTHENNEFIEMSVRRKCREHSLAMITKYSNPHVIAAMENDDDGVNYEGAHVEEAFSGVKTNVVGVDLASLYPMTQWMLNASPDARIDRKRAWKEDIPHVVAENGQTFRTDHDGIIRELVDEYHEVKREFKAERNAAEYGTEEWEEAAEAYSVTKTIYNSFYGYSGWDRSPLYNPDDAAAITLTGQRVIKRTTEYISEETVAEVAYGDTDSNYVEFPSEWGQVETLEYAEKMCETLTNEVYPELCEEFLIPEEDNRWEIEMEMRAQRFFQSGSKKQYAYLKTWDEGDDFDNVVGIDKPAPEVDWENDDYGKFSVTGYQCVKSNFALITKETQEEVLEAIVRGADKPEIADIMFEAASSIDATDPDWEHLGMPQGIGNKFDAAKGHQEDVPDDYYSFTDGTPKGAHPRGAWFANQMDEVDVEFGQGDKPMRAYLKPTLTVEDADGEDTIVDVIDYENERDLEPIMDDLKMDVTAMQEKTLKNPMTDILDSFGMEVDAAIQGNAQSQSALGAFM